MRIFSGCLGLLLFVTAPGVIGQETSLEQLVEDAIEQAKQIIEMNKGMSTRMMSTHSYVKFTKLTESLGESSNINLIAYEILVQNGVDRNEAIGQLINKRHAFCTAPIMRCSPTSKYRTINGTCNNLNHDMWGASFTAFNRVIPASYLDGYNMPVGGDGKKAPISLPNPRLISTSIHPDLVQNHARVTNMLPQFGQFVDHDISLTPEGDKRCCKGDRSVDCFSISIPGNDTFYSSLLDPQTCMDFTRSTPFCFPGPAGVREQLNILTAYVDASQVYGSTDERLRLVREFSQGRLRTNKNNPRYPPTKAELEALTGEEIEFMGTFVAGDERVNEMPALLTLHTLFLREHNRIAAEVLKLRPSWNDAQIFEETRRIVIAEWQNIVYGEYLPVLLGAPTMNTYRLTLDDDFSFYDSSVDATVFHAFATAAYRFGHTFINGLVQLMRGLTNIGSYRIRDNFFVPNQMIMDGGQGYNHILGGLMLQNAQNYDPFVTVDFTNFVLRNPNDEFGADLIARNLQRGRDHALQPFMSYRRLCGLTTSSSWANRPTDIRTDTWAQLQNLYRSPNEIELFTGGLAEVPQGTALTGATFNCLKAMQFQRLKRGDRFFFTHQDQAGSFSLAQIMNIRRRTLGDVICENSDVEQTPRNVFLIRSASNPLVACNATTRVPMDLNLLLS